MPRINLLPWREELRAKRRTQFYAAIGGAFAGALLVVLIANTTYNAIIGQQRERNDFLRDEITALDRRIEEILGLEEQKERLLARMEIIEQLQRSRPEIVHLFDEITRQMPEGVYLNGMQQQGSSVELKGVAQSSTRVSALMRQTDQSAWLTDPSVTKVETTEQGPARQAEFVVTLKQTSPMADEEAGL